MWQHKIIEYIRSINNISKTEDLTKSIITSKCFYFGDYRSYTNKNNLGVLKNWNFPFDNMIVEMIFPVNCKNVTGIEEDTINCKTLVHLQKNIYGLEKHLSKFFNSIDNIFSITMFVVSEKNEVFPFPLTAFLDTVMGRFVLSYNIFAQEDDKVKDNSEENTKFFNTILCITHDLIEFLNCTNVYTENVVPSGKLNKARLRKNKEPFYMYKILKVKKGVPKVKYTNVSHNWGEHIPDCITAEHVCRGHFKVFTPEKPLFGKYAGTFWWGPQVRGNRSIGIIEKEYTVS